MIQYRHHPDPHQYAREHRNELLVAVLTILLAHAQAVQRGSREALLPRIGSFGNWSDRIRSAVWWVDPDRCDPWDGNAEVKANAQPEQVEATMFFEAWHGAVGTAQVSAKDIEARCRLGSHGYDSDLAEAVKMLSIPEPRGNAAVNTRALGQWLAAHKDHPGRFVLREGERKSGRLYWYVEEEELTQSAIRTMVEAVIKDLLVLIPIDDTGKPSDKYERKLREALLKPSKLEDVECSFSEDSTLIMIRLLEVFFRYVLEVLSPDRGVDANEKHSDREMDTRVRLYAVSTMLRMGASARGISESPAYEQIVGNFVANENATWDLDAFALMYMKQALHKLGKEAAVDELYEEAIRRLAEDSLRDTTIDKDGTEEALKLLAR